MVAILIIIPVILLLIILVYNNLIKKRNAIDNAFFSMDVMLKKRYDLIPQLVNTVKGYMLHEKDMLFSLTEMRSKLTLENLNTNEKVTLDNQINANLQTIFINFENYPALKANTSFLKLQGAINETEEQLAASRRFYNAAVNDYHNAIEMFPSNIIASFLRLKHKAYFNIPDTEKKEPVINVN